TPPPEKHQSTHATHRVARKSVAYERYLQEGSGRSAGRKIRQKKARNEVVVVRRLGCRLRRLDRQDWRAADDRGSDMALDPGTKIRSRMLMAVRVRLAERVVQLEGRGQRRERHQGQPQDQEQRHYEKTRFHHLRQLPL